MKIKNVFLLSVLLVFSGETFGQIVPGSTQRKSDTTYKYPDSLSAINARCLAERKNLFSWDFTAGIIYFSGTNFPNVAIVKLGKNGNTELRQFAERVVPGTNISYEYVFYKDEKNKIVGPITKSVRL